MKKSYYIAEIFLPNKSAYSTHVIKMCNELTNKFSSTELILFHSMKNITYQKLKKDYILTGRKSFKIKNFFSYQKNINFIKRLFFGYRVANYLKNKKKDFVITRSLITSFFLSLHKIYHKVEIHNELNGLTKFLLINLNFLNSNYVEKVIFISYELSKKFSTNKKLILHDAVDIRNFNKIKIKNKFKNVGYVGSFYKGRGIELIIQLARKNLNLNFFLIGQVKKFKSFSKLTPNVKILKHAPYSEIPTILSKLDIVLMPYQKVVQINSDNLNTASYCSPLKMFDYLASGRIILSSNLPGIKEILKNNYNSIIVNNYSVYNWDKSIKRILTNKTLANKLSINAYNTALNNTWQRRLNKIIESN